VVPIGENLGSGPLTKGFITTSWETPLVAMFGRSTVLQLLHLMDKWTKCLESGGHINAIYYDFKKAFD